MAENTIQWDKDADGIVTLTMDDPSGSANVMNEAYIESMGKAVDRLVAEKDSITGVVITSAKKTFFAGGDLTSMITAGKEGLLRTGDHHAGDRMLLRGNAIHGLAHRLDVGFVHYVGRPRRVVHGQCDDAVGIFIPLNGVVCHAIKPSR